MQVYKRNDNKLSLLTQVNKPN